MGANSKIEWCDATWNPVRGCSRVSQGCVNCYAEIMAARFSGPGQAFEGFADRRTGKWTGKVAVIESQLDLPLRWRKPRRIFVNSMSDLFHEKLTELDIGRVVSVIGHACHHDMLVLTKRPKYAREFAMWWCDRHGTDSLPPNMWLGVSVEDQKTADERIPLLLDTPAAVRFVSYEPALGPVDFTRLNLGTKVTRGYGPRRIEWDGLSMWEHQFPKDAESGCDPAKSHMHINGQHPRLDWIIVGGESGPNARPFDIAWARSIVAQCKAAGVACFVKQLGSKPFDSSATEVAPPITALIRDRKGGDMSEWPEDLRVRQFPESMAA